MSDLQTIANTLDRFYHLFPPVMPIDDLTELEVLDTLARTWRDSALVAG